MSNNQGKGFKRTENLPWEMVGTIKADGEFVSIFDLVGFGGEIFSVAIKPAALSGNNPNTKYPMFVKQSIDRNKQLVIHHIMISFDSGEVE